MQSRAEALVKEWELEGEEPGSLDSSPLKRLMVAGSLSSPRHWRLKAKAARARGKSVNKYNRRYEEDDDDDDKEDVLAVLDPYKPAMETVKQQAKALHHSSKYNVSPSLAPSYNVNVLFFECEDSDSSRVGVN